MKNDLVSLWESLDYEEGTNPLDASPLQQKIDVLMHIPLWKQPPLLRENIFLVSKRELCVLGHTHGLTRYHNTSSRERRS